jgi:adenine-specific DNA-methyltransferase
MASNTTPRKNPTRKSVETLKHDTVSRLNIPTAEYQSVMQKEEQNPVRVAYERRNRDLDPQLVWRGKDEQDWSDLVVHAPPLYIQEKVHPKVLIDDLLKQTREQREHEVGAQPDLFADFNGIPKEVDKTEFYRHEQNWSNRMILGDSLQVMASLAEREGLRGKVQCIYLDPPYGIKFNSNFQWSTTSRDVKDGNVEHITREPEQVKAFRDTWRDGIHSYLTYLRDRLTVARDLLSESGSIFVQIGDENVHRVRAVMDEVFGEANLVSLITVWKTSSQTSSYLASTSDYVAWYGKDVSKVKYRQLLTDKDPTDPRSGAADYRFLWLGFDERKNVEAATPEERKRFRVFAPSPTTSQSGSATTRMPVEFCGRTFSPGPGGWKTNLDGFRRLIAADRIMSRSNSLRYVRFLDDYPVVPLANLWTDVRWGFDASQKIYVVQTNPRVVERCILMSTDPGDLVLDPTCGSGTAAYVAEQWGRRWITIDTSRVALALARARIMGARYPYYLLADTPEGQMKEAEITRSAPSRQSTCGDIRQGFVYQRVPHIMLESIANNAEIDVIWEQWQAKLEPLREALKEALQKSW